MTPLPANSGAASRRPQSAEELASVLDLLRSLFEQPQQQELFDPAERPTHQLVYTHGVTL